MIISWLYRVVTVLPTFWKTISFFGEVFFFRYKFICCDFYFFVFLNYQKISSKIYSLID